MGTEKDQPAISPLRKGLVASPGMVMALGIFLKFSGVFLLEKVLNEPLLSYSLTALAILLGAWAAYLAYLLIDQAFKNRKVVWDYTVAHFAIGTWVAGINVWSTVIAPISHETAMAANAVGWALWVLYMIWLMKMVFHTEQRMKVHGVIFLTTVATQSVVVSTSVIYPDASQLLRVLLALNIFGVVLYCIHFYMIWIMNGVKYQLENWVPPNNITHGALSITILATELIAINNPDVPYLKTAISITWIIAACLFLIVFLIELSKLLKTPTAILTFQMPNYARNFTYGMFFACTYVGYMKLPELVMHQVFSGTALLILAMVVLLVNGWEVGHQIRVTSLARASRS